MDLMKICMRLFDRGILILTKFPFFIFYYFLLLLFLFFFFFFEILVCLFCAALIHLGFCKDILDICKKCRRVLYLEIQSDLCKHSI